MLNEILNWCLPVHCNWFILHIIIGIVMSVLLWVWAYNGYWGEETYTESKLSWKVNSLQWFLRGCVATFVNIVTVAIILWLCHSGYQDKRIAREERCEIKPVTYPDGKVVQMFNHKGTNYNANVMYGSTPPPGSYVRVIVWQNVYSGIFWPSNKSNFPSKLDDSYILVLPDSSEKPAGNVTVGQ